MNGKKKILAMTVLKLFSSLKLRLIIQAESSNGDEIKKKVEMIM